MNQNKKLNWQETEILITGGTGSLGKTLIRKLQNVYRPKGIRIYSRDEFKQWQLKRELEKEGLDNNVAFLIGDVRDKSRLDRAVRGVDLVFNTAAMKQVPACEDNPIEAVKTNINGASNLIDACLDNSVKICIHVSTDKSVYPVNLYGATKTVAEKLFIHSNIYSGGRGTIFSCVRYGNVLGSRGSIIPLFREQAKSGVVTLTHLEMTRFFITLDEVALFIIDSAEKTTGAEIFIPKMKSLRIVDLKEAVCPEADVEVIGIRDGEKLHEVLISEEESEFAKSCGNRYIISNKKVGDKFIYSSGQNALTVPEIKKLVEEAGI